MSLRKKNRGIYIYIYILDATDNIFGFDDMWGGQSMGNRNEL